MDDRYFIHPRWKFSKDAYLLCGLKCLVNVSIFKKNNLKSFVKHCEHLPSRWLRAIKWRFITLFSHLSIMFCNLCNHALGDSFVCRKNKTSAAFHTRLKKKHVTFCTLNVSLKLFLSILLRGWSLKCFQDSDRKVCKQKRQHMFLFMQRYSHLNIYSSILTNSSTASLVTRQKPSIAVQGS